MIATISGQHRQHPLVNAWIVLSSLWFLSRELFVAELRIAMTMPAPDSRASTTTVPQADDR